MKPNTIRTHKLWLEKFPEINNQTDFVEYISSLEDKYSDNSINGIIVAFHHFIDYLRYNNIFCPFKKIKTRRHNPSPVKDFLTPSQIKQIVEAHVPYSTATSYLNEVYGTFWLFLALTGARVSEAMNLRVSDVSYSEKFCWFNDRKAGDTLKVVLPSHLVTKLEHLRKVSESEYVFSNSLGNKLDPTSVREDIKRRAKIARIKERVYPHILRHSFCSILLSEGVPIETVAKLVGHSKLNTTYAHYAHLLDKTLRDAVDSHPLVCEYLDPKDIVKQDLVKLKKLRIFNDDRIFTKVSNSDNHLEIVVAVK